MLALQFMLLLLLLWKWLLIKHVSAKTSTTVAAYYVQFQNFSPLNYESRWRNWSSLSYFLKGIVQLQIIFLNMSLSCDSYTYTRWVGWIFFFFYIFQSMFSTIQDNFINKLTKDASNKGRYNGDEKVNYYKNSFLVKFLNYPKKKVIHIF